MPIVTWIKQYAERLRFPYLLLITALLFVFDLFVPDALPMADEILLGLGTLVLAGLRKQVREGRGAAKTKADDESL